MSKLLHSLRLCGTTPTLLWCHTHPIMLPYPPYYAPYCGATPTLLWCHTCLTMVPHPPYYGATPALLWCHTHPTMVPHPPVLPGGQIGTSGRSLHTNSSKPPPQGRCLAPTCPGSESQPSREGVESGEKGGGGKKGGRRGRRREEGEKGGREREGEGGRDRGKGSDPVDEWDRYNGLTQFMCSDKFGLCQ